MDKEKTIQLLTYVIQRHSKATRTVLMKLAYLIDLTSVKKTGNMISEFEYKRYIYGPYDPAITTLLTTLEESRTVKGIEDYTVYGDEFIRYELFEVDTALEFDKLSDNECRIIDTVLEELKGYGAKALTDIAYQTPPMKKIGATRGGIEHFNEKLDLYCD